MTSKNVASANMENVVEVELARIKRERQERERPSVASGASVASPPPPPWPEIDADAYHGLAGEVVNTIKPHTEADPVAVLLQLLAAAGNVIGPLPYYQVESDRHRANLFVAAVGDSSRARKGTGMGRVRAITKVVDETWNDDRIKSGLSSGEGLINEVRDERKEWNKKEAREEVVDPGVTDKRLMVVEPELAGALSAMERHGNTLSPVIRKAWEDGKLATITKSSPLKATGAHISIIGHITIEELRARLSRTDTANGFANRFLFALSKRWQLLPHGGDLNDAVLEKLGQRLKAVVERASKVGRVMMTDAAKEAWTKVYPDLTATQHGLLGAVVARGEAQTIRLALLYALLDCEDGQPCKIDLPHLKAALAVWQYCEASAAYIFGDTLGDPAADEIRRALKMAGDSGMTRTAIRDLSGRHLSGGRIGAALTLLATRGWARMEPRETGGRPVEVWHSTER
jgi:Protein of unknown function (DUF3987)